MPLNMEEIRKFYKYYQTHYSSHDIGCFPIMLNACMNFYCAAHQNVASADDLIYALQRLSSTSNGQHYFNFRPYWLDHEDEIFLRILNILSLKEFSWTDIKIYVAVWLSKEPISDIFNLGFPTENFNAAQKWIHKTYHDILSSVGTNE